MSPHLSPCQVEAVLDRLLQDYPETVSRWVVGVVAEPPELARAWLLEAALNCLLAAYPEVVARWAMGLMAEPPEEIRAWLMAEEAGR